MLTAAATMQLARPLLSRLVQHEQQEHGSRMVAYDEAGQAIGASGSWVRKFLGGENVRLEGHELLNLVIAFDRLCERLERDAEHDRRIARALRGETDAAAVEGALGAALRLGGQASGGARASDALVGAPDGEADRRGLMAADPAGRGGETRSALGRAAGEMGR